MARRVKNPIEELEELAENSTAALRRELEPLGRAIVRGDDRARARALEQLAELLGQTMALADLLGRRRLLLEADAVGRSPGQSRAPAIAFKETPIVPRVEFREVLEDLVRREPRLAESRDGVPLWRQVAELYQSGHNFALARAADLALTEQVREFLRGGIEQGFPRASIQDAIARIGDFSRSYAETVYRTNLNTAFTAGRFQQVREPGVREVIGAFGFEAVLDGDVRENHRAAHGLIASPDDTVWETLSPPLGFNCRCSVRMVSRFELERRGLIEGEVVERFEPPGFSGAFPDPGFEKSFRTDRRIYG